MDIGHEGAFLLQWISVTVLLHDRWGASSLNHAGPKSLLLLMLTMTSGCVDAITFLSLGQVFAAAMTGNTVLFGLAAVHASSLTLTRYVMALCGFVLGNAIAALICSRVRTETGWTRTLTVALLGELMLLFGAALLMDTQPDASPNLLILCFSAAMGIQGVVARRVGVNGMTTTVITSTLTGMVESVIWNVQSKVPVAFDGPSGQSHVTPWSSIASWFGAIMTYGVGAAICGFMERHAFHVAVWLPAGFVLAVILASMGVAYATGQQRGPEPSGFRIK